MEKREARFCSELNKWLTYNMEQTCFIEAKVGIGSKPINFKSAFKDHQIPTLLQINKGPFAYKISDMDRMQKPFDIMFAYKSRTYIAFHWVERGNKRFYLIDPEEIVKLQELGHKSIDEKMAHLIAEYVGELR